MTKKKHPQSRAERLKIKRLKFEEHQKERELAGKIRQRYNEWLKDEETQNELNTVRGTNSFDRQFELGPGTVPTTDG